MYRKWAPLTDEDSGCNTIHQIVVPVGYRAQILTHDSVMGGHLGISKTYYRILGHFFWPGLKSDVVKYCCSCHACRLVVKPPLIPPAPLHPIPVMGEPFERVIIDCVGPLPSQNLATSFSWR